jgi:hypothetical protein
MKTVGDKLADAETRHTVYLLRWSASMYKRHSKLLDQMEADIATKIAMRAPDDGTFTSRRLQMMLAEVETKSNELFKALESATDGDYQELAAYEARFHVRAISNAYPIDMALAKVTPVAVHSAAMSQPFLGKVMKGWWKGQNAATKDAYNRALRIGFAQGDTISQMVNRVGDVGQKTRRDVEMIIRTGTAHMSQRAMDKVTEANADLFSGEEFIATLDGRTTSVCMGNDGEVFLIGEGPQLPLHWGERSKRIPKTKSWKELGFTDKDIDKPLASRRFIADKRRLKDIPKDQRDALTGRTTKSYNEWLKTQPRQFIDDVLGKKKAKLYLDGGLPLDKFTDRKSNPLTLAELEKRESAAFKRAGVEL